MKCSSVETLSQSATELRVVLAYENLSAALDAAETLTMLSRKERDGLRLRLSPWSYAALGEPRCRAMALRDVGRADLVVVASRSTPHALSAMVESWLKTCLGRRGEPRLAIAALFGCDDHRDGTDSPRLQAVQRLAKEAGCVFFAPGLSSGISFSA